MSGAGVRPEVRPAVRPDVRTMAGAAAPPTRNGELVFDEPWQARAFALAVAIVERLGLPWDAFRQRLVAAIADDPERPYYDSWTAALESLIADHGLTRGEAFERS